MRLQVMKFHYYLIFLTTGLLAVTLTFQQCSNVQLTQELVQKKQVNSFSGSFCFPYSSKEFSKYQLGDFYALNLTNRNAQNALMSDSNLNGVLDGSNGDDASVVVVNDADRDLDGVPDFVEVLKGLNPQIKDLNSDEDHDGIANKQEIQKGSDPEFHDKEGEFTEVQVDLLTDEAGGKENCGEGQYAYHFVINNIATGVVAEFNDTLNSHGPFNLSHSQDENLILLLFRMKTENLQLSDYYFAKIIKTKVGEQPNIELSPKDFQLLPVASSAACETCQNRALNFDYSKVATGELHSCALEKMGKVLCWGNNQYGQLGDGSFKSSLGPVQVRLPLPAKDIAIGAFHGCAILKSDELYCWGASNYGQAGDMLFQDLNIPAKVPLEAKPLSISLGKEHSCVESANSSIYCWGRNRFSQLGISSSSLAYTAQPQKIILNSASNVVKPEFPLLQMTSGNDFNCIADKLGLLYCWGSLSGVTFEQPLMLPVNTNLGPTTFKFPEDAATDSYVRNWFNRNKFQTISTNGKVVISTYGTQLSTVANNMVACWGKSVRLVTNKDNACPTRYDEEGQINNEFPYAAYGLSSVRALSISSLRGCAIEQNSATQTQLKCWGYDYETKLNNPQVSTVFAINNPVSVSVSGGHTCAIDGIGKIWCWGRNSQGQTGSSSYGEKVSPELVFNQ